MEDSYNAHKFYNNNRKTLGETSLHNGNLPQKVYSDVMFLRNFLPCRETMPSRNNVQQRFSYNGRHNKENK